MKIDFFCQKCIAPEWAADCMITSLPSLTIQYMSDSGTVQLTRDCGLEGVKRITCSGKQDNIDLLKRELMCLSERENNNAKEQQQLPIHEDSSSTASSTTVVINSNEQTSNQIEKSVEKPSVTEINTSSKSKSLKKIASEKPLKNQPKLMKKYKEMLSKNLDDMMMGDEPADVEKIHEEFLNVVNSPTKRSELPIVKPGQTSTQFPTTRQEITSPESNTRSRRNSEVSSTSIFASSTESLLAVSSELTILATTESISTLAATHNSTQSPNDHFVPPMLLVRHEDKSIKSTSKDPEISTAIPPTEMKLEGSSSQTAIVPETTKVEVISTQEPTESTASQTTTSELTAAPELAQTSTSNMPTTVAAETSEVPATIEVPATSSTTTPATISHEQPKQNVMMRPHAPKRGGEIHFHAPNAVPNPVQNHFEAPTTQFHYPADSANMPDRNPHFIAEISHDLHGNKTIDLAISTNSVELSHSTLMPKATEEMIVASGDNQFGENHDEHGGNLDEHGSGEDEKKRRADFTNSDVEYKPYKPNRRRVLTKPETHSYIQRVLGRR